MELSYGSTTTIHGRTSEIDDELDKDFPLMIKTPQLEGPLAFTPEALKVWGQVHIDNSERSLHFHDQLREWKKTKVELQKVLSQAYKETSKLKQHVISNEVTQDHIYVLHNQVKHTAKRVHKVSQGIDQLIDIALKQMMLNIDAVRDFSTVLHAIPFDTLSIQDFYRSLRSFYISLLECYMERYGKNNPFMVNVNHAFEAFLQKCDSVEALPGSIAQFSGMTASII